MADLLRDRLQDSLGAAYTLTRELGGGGMSRVFVAHDEALGREVAVKVLPPDASALVSAERFKREIALAARLQHPHIVPILSAGQSGEVLYYTMPLVEGESLRGRLDREGELPVGEVVGILREAARALAYAHEHGVVHRDIKPDNVMLSGGSVMVTDFGVAKAIAAGGHAADPAHVSGAGLTSMGIALGTPAYMSPEQAAADPSVDHRADLYALGCMAYEMLTGRAPFAGRSVPAILAAHMSEAPEPVEQRRPSVPPALAALVAQCLEKHPADRPHSAAEVVRALDVIAVTPGGTASVRAPMGAVGARARRPSRALALLPWGVAAATLAALAWQGTAARTLRGREAAVRFSIMPLPGEGPLLAEADPAVSPDGRFVVYRAAVGSGSRLDLREVGDFAPRPLEGTEGATHPAFSPDGQWIAYFAGGRLLRMPRDGGPATTIADVPGAMGASWGPSGEIVAGAPPGVRGAGLVRIPLAGGAPRPFTRPPAGSGESHVMPVVLDARTVVFKVESATGGPTASVLAVASLETGEYVRLDLPAVRPLGVVEGRLVYARSDGAIMAVPFDARGRRTTGDPRPLGVQAADFALATALSPAGTLVYAHGDTRSRLVWMDSRGGGVRALADEPRLYEFPRLSPDGARLAVTIYGAQSADVWLCDVAACALTRATSQGSINDRPEWTPDGRRLVFRSTRDGGSAIWWQLADGSGAPERLTAGASVWEGVVSPDGRMLLYRETVPGRAAYRLMYLALDGDRTPRAFAAGEAGNVQMPRFSRDGRWVAYQSDASGQFEVYVRPFPDGGRRWQLSAGGGTEPLWSADGRRLHYRRGTQLVTAALTLGDEVAVGARDSVMLDPGAAPQSRTHPKYDVARDGRVVMPQRLGEVRLGVAVNWAAELRGRAARQ